MKRKYYNTRNRPVYAKYLYDPYGNMLAQYGSLADANIYRFSSKEWIANSGIYYYLFRFYDPNLQRWLNMDPVGEDNGVNLYEMVGDCPIDNYDEFGYGPPGCGAEQAAVDQAQDKLNDDKQDGKNACAHAENDMIITGGSIAAGFGGLGVATWAGPENPGVGAAGIGVAGIGLGVGIAGMCVCAQDGAEIDQARRKIDKDRKNLNDANQALKDCQAKAKKPSEPSHSPHPQPIT
jgi:RHS repeat-associated protein